MLQGLDGAELTRASRAVFSAGKLATRHLLEENEGLRHCLPLVRSRATIPYLKGITNHRRGALAADEETRRATRVPFEHTNTFHHVSSLFGVQSPMVHGERGTFDPEGCCPRSLDTSSTDWRFWLEQASRGTSHHLVLPGPRKLGGVGTRVKAFRGLRERRSTENEKSARQRGGLARLPSRLLLADREGPAVMEHWTSTFKNSIGDGVPRLCLRVDATPPKQPPPAHRANSQKRQAARTRLPGYCRPVPPVRLGGQGRPHQRGCSCCLTNHDPFWRIDQEPHRKRQSG